MQVCETPPLPGGGEKGTLTAVRAGAAGGGVDLGPRRRRRLAGPHGPEANAAAGGDGGVVVAGGLGGRAAPAAAASAAAAPAPALPLPLLLPGALPPVELPQLRRREPHGLASPPRILPEPPTHRGRERTRSAPDNLHRPRRRTPTRPPLPPRDRRIGAGNPTGSPAKAAPRSQPPRRIGPNHAGPRASAARSHRIGSVSRARSAVEHLRPLLLTPKDHPLNRHAREHLAAQQPSRAGAPLPGPGRGSGGGGGGCGWWWWWCERERGEGAGEWGIGEAKGKE
jgi:hypothetical protein